MTPSAPPPTVDLARGEHFSCALSAVLLARLRDHGGQAAVDRVLREAASLRTEEYLSEVGNWIAYNEASALWRAATAVTHHPELARAVGADSVRRLGGSPVATVLRSLGGPAQLYQQLAIAGSKYTTVTELTLVDAGVDRVHIEARPVPGFARDHHHCGWTIGLLATAPTLYGLAPATVEHEICAAHGAEACDYRITWSAAAAVPPGGPAHDEVTVLRQQLATVERRLRGMLHTVSDLIEPREVEAVVTTIAERAAQEIRAPRHLMAVRLGAGAPLVRARGMHGLEAAQVADRLLAADLDDPGTLPRSWVVAPIASGAREYGRMLAAFPTSGFLEEERQLLHAYARLAAAALDSATALERATSRERQSRALLELAREVSVAGTQSEIARLLVESVRLVVDCDRVAVYLRDGDRLVREAVIDHGAPIAPADAGDEGHGSVSTLRRMLRRSSPDPVLVDLSSHDGRITAAMRAVGITTAAFLPLLAAGEVLGVLSIGVRGDAERLTLDDDLRRRLAGVAAEASHALQNGRLVDVIVHQARHDQLTGLINRGTFAEALELAITEARGSGATVAAFYIDLDDFKPVNDELGHDAGDALLVAVAERLQGAIRDGDVAARLGGDEFGVLVTAPGPEQAAIARRRLVAAFDEPLQVGEDHRQILASVGCATFPHEAQDAHDLLLRADQAMFDVKRARSGGVRRRPAVRPVVHCG